MAKSFTFTVIDPVGLHARPATVLVTACSKVKSDVTVNWNGKSGNAKSIFAIMGMGVPTQATVEVVAEGEDEDAAIETIAQILKDEKVCE